MADNCTTEPILRWDKARALWVTLRPVCATARMPSFTGWYHWSVHIEVPAGFYTDLATIPWPLVAVPGAARYGNHNRAAVVHDWLYWTRGRVDEYTRLTRRQADDLFFDIMQEDGVPAWKAWAMWAAVRVSPSNWGKFNE